MLMASVIRLKTNKKLNSKLINLEIFLWKSAFGAQPLFQAAYSNILDICQKKIKIIVTGIRI